MELTFRITLQPKQSPFSTASFMKCLSPYKLKNKKFVINKCMLSYESADMNLNEVKPHNHGYIKFSGITEPTFRKLFKIYVLKMDAHVKQKRGNALYTISKVRTSAGEYLSYMNKNEELPNYDKNPDYYTQNPTWFGFVADEYRNVQQLWLKSKLVKDDFKVNKKFLAGKIQKLQEEFKNSTEIWVKNKQSLEFGVCKNVRRNLTLDYLKIYIECGVSWKRYQVESKINLWWYMKYPQDLEKYVENLY